MKRFVFVLAACGTAPAPKPPDPVAAPVDTRITLDAWIERWRAARACMVEAAPDLESGVAAAWRLGRDCTPLVRAMYIEPRFHESLFAMWRIAIRLVEMLEAETQSASARAQRIEEIDKTLEAFAQFEREGGIAPPVEVK